MNYCHDMSEIEIEHCCYCAENGYFCRYLDKASGICVATSCKAAQELLQQVEIEKRGQAQQELKDGFLALENDLYTRALEQLENYGATMIDLDISEEDWNAVKRSW